MRRLPVPLGRRPATAHVDPQTLVVWIAIGLNSIILAGFAIARHRSYWTARFDVGNMWQAIWTTAHGDILLSTNGAGEQASRLAGHVDPLLLVFTPIAWITRSPVPILVLQPFLVALGALPLYALARRYFAGWPAVACALTWLLYPPLWWLVLDEFHPVAFAAPLLVGCVWAIETGRNGWLATLAVLAALSKEEVGLTLAVLGIWMAVRQGRRRAGLILAACSTAWVFFCVAVIIPHYNNGQGSDFVARYGELGTGAGDVVKHLLTHPWEIITTGLAPSGLSYLAALLLPLLLLPFASSLVVAAVPEILLNVLADWPPQHSIEFHYVAVPAGILIPAAVLGLNRVRGWRLVARRASVGALAAGLVAASVLAMAITGPVPGFEPLSVASKSRVAQYSRSSGTQDIDRAIARIPVDAPVSAGNYIGGHLSARSYVATFPVIGQAQFVIVDARRPAVGFRIDRFAFSRELAQLQLRPDFRLASVDGSVSTFVRKDTN